jgi:hypothetical protein
VAGVVAEAKLADPRVVRERPEDVEDRRGLERGAEHGQVDVSRDHQAEGDAPDLHGPPHLFEQRQQLEVREHRGRLVLERLLLVEQAAHRRFFFLSHRLCRSRSFFSSGASGP